MKYQYNKPRIQIKNWFVSQTDIERIVSFFKERFGVNNIPIEVKTVDGNDRIYETFEEMCLDIPKLIADKETIINIGVSYRYADPINYHNFKQVWIEIRFGHYCEVNFHIVAGDTDGAYKDWVSGTYDQMLKFVNIFEIKDEKIIKKMREVFSSNIIFDPYESEKEKIQRMINEPKIKVDKPIKWWERNWVQILFVLGALAGIVGLYPLFK